MVDKNLTPNFKLSEFTTIAVSDYQLSLLQLLANNLQIVRDSLQEFAVAGKNVSITITSGVRTQADYDRLKAKGYNPSATSDHFCGLQLQSKPTLGAVDIVVNNCTLSHRQIAAKIIEWDKAGKVHFGQVIYEYNPANKVNWVHLGNDWKQIFSDKINFARAKYLMSLDNGKSYVSFTLA